MNRIGYVTVVLAVSIVVMISSTVEASAIPQRPVRGRSPCACPRMYDPICASNGITYGNECTFLCAQRKLADLRMVKRDACDSEFGLWEEIPKSY